MAQAVEYLPCRQEALRSITGLAKKPFFKKIKIEKFKK
jgi:hypothetical protein